MLPYSGQYSINRLDQRRVGAYVRSLNTCKLSLMPWLAIVPRYTWNLSRSLTRSPSLEALFTCNGLLAEQLDTCQYLDLHFAFIKGYIPPYHTSEGKGNGLLGCSIAKAFSIAMWQHSQPQSLPTAKHPCALSALRL